jgi:hypothetical protein
MSRQSEFSFSSLLCVVVLLAAAMGSAQTAPSQDADPSAAQPATQSGAATIAPSRPAMAYSKAQRRQNDLAARSQFLAQWKQRSATSAPHKKKASPAFGGTWQLGPIVTNGSPICNPLLLTDATVIAIDCDGTSGEWYKLTPDITGSYVNGTWTEIATLPVFYNVDGWVEIQYAPLYFASAVLPDGRVIVMGGEFNGPYYGLPVGAIYDPVANTWTPVSAPPGAGWVQQPLAIGDAQSTVLADGTFLLAACCAFDPDLDALFDATNLTWTSTGAPNAGGGIQDEQGYTLLPNGNVLTVDIGTGCSSPSSCNGPNPTNAEQYNPTTGTWSSAGNSVVSLVDPYACGNYEIGPAPLRPDGTVVQFGGNTGCTGDADPTGIYDSTTGVWSAGPNVPEVCGSNGTTQCDLADAPAAVLPNGNILFGAETGAYEPPSHFFEFTTLNAINQVADDAGASFAAAFQYNFLVLPNGQILTTVGVDQPEFYTPTGSPDPSWAPVISTSPSSVYPGTTYTITGTQLNGLTQGAYYGDDFQMATNYPIVQITNSATGHVFYGRTFNISNRSVAPGVSVSTDFTVPANIEWGPSTLVVIANGIPSTPVPVGIAVPTVGVSSSLNPSVYGQAVSFTATVTGASPTGSVQFNIDGSAFGSPVTLASGTATSGTTSTLSPGTHTVTAVYSGDTNNAQGTGSLNGGQVVNQSSVNVTVATSPSGLLVSVDGGPAQAAPVVVSWTIGSLHTIATTSPQGSGGTQYTWSSWSDGGAISHQVTASANVTGYTASFISAYLLTTAASPTNGGTVTPASGTYYAPNTVVNLTATANPNYAFSSWTGNVANPNSASTTVTMTGPQSVTANFAPTTVNVTVGANPAGVAFSVDGTNYSSAQIFTWNVGDMHTIGTTTPQYPFAGTQETFASWSDGGAINHTVTASAATTSYTASFNPSYLLLTAAYPANGGTVAPPSGSYYAPNTVVNLSATPNPNYAFSNWTGNVANANSASTTVTMTGPQSVTANFVPASLTVSPTSVSFGNVLECRTKKAVLTLTNNSSTKAQIGALSFVNVNGNPGDFTYDEYCRPTLAAGKHCTIAVRFSPSEDAAESATLNIPTSDGTLQVPITGTGVPNNKCEE